MKYKNLQKKQQTPNAILWLFLLAISTTLYFNPGMADPFNAAKLHVLIIGSSWLVGYLVISRNSESVRYKKLFLLVGVFEIILLFLAIITDLKHTAFFGGVLRQLGFIAYSGFAICMLVSAKYFSYKSRVILYSSTLFVGVIYIIYGLMQHTGNDFIRWVNQYNPIIETLGNPNFAAAFMAMIATLIFSFMFNNSISKSLRFLCMLVTIGLLTVIVLSSALQGLLSSIAGILLFICIQIYKTNRKFGILGFIGLFLLSFISVLGTVQIGPLEKYLYKESVSLRGYYWRAGINMLREYPFTGVGIDRYGENFKLYREIAYPLRYGFELNSTNAHNTPIQLFATGGLFLGLSYLAIIFYIFYCGLNGIKFLPKSEQIFLSGIFCAWIAYLLQSLVSIDNLGLTIWGWILGGAIVALSKTRDDPIKVITKISSKAINKSNTTSLKQSLISGVLVVLAFIFVLNLAKSEFNSMAARNRVNSQVLDNSNVVREMVLYANLVIKDPFAQPALKMESAYFLLRGGLNSDGFTALEDLIKVDPKSQAIFTVLAASYEENSRFEDAIRVRTQLINRDPQNAKNYLQLARLYKEIGNNVKANEMKEMIILIAPNSEAADFAKKEIQP